MKPPMKMGPPKKPSVPAEMKELEKFIGNSTWTGEMVSPTKEEVMKHMPPGSKEPPTTFAGGGKSEWAFGKLALKAEGWYDMGEGQKGNYIEDCMWDARAKKYHTWTIDDLGKTAAGWPAPCADCDGLCTTGPVVRVVSPSRTAFDFDAVAAIDLSDFAAFARTLSGP